MACCGGKVITCNNYNIAVNAITCFDNLIQVSKVASTCEELVFTLARCLPKIVPTVLLQKRDQLIPLLLGTAAMHPSADERNQILHDLFNLIKKPNACERYFYFYFDYRNYFKI